MFPKLSYVLAATPFISGKKILEEGSNGGETHSSKASMP